MSKGPAARSGLFVWPQAEATVEEVEAIHEAVETHVEKTDIHKHAKE
jgi:hypothetical protein